VSGQVGDPNNPPYVPFSLATGRGGTATYIQDIPGGDGSEFEQMADCPLGVESCDQESWSSAARRSAAGADPASA
jgi:hypothetical protein